MVVEDAGEEKRIDCRPSDAIALALRTAAPIFIADEVVEKSFVYIDPSEFVEPLKFKDED